MSEFGMFDDDPRDGFRVEDIDLHSVFEAVVWALAAVVAAGYWVFVIGAQKWKSPFP